MKPGGENWTEIFPKKKSKREDKNKNGERERENKKTKPCELKERLWGTDYGVNEHPTPRQSCLFDP